MIGDVQGHSLEAAVVMAELRYSLRAYAFEGHDPATVADLLDDLLTRTGSDLIATACLLVVEPDRRRMQVVSAGHPPPVLAREGHAELLDSRDPLLGIGVAGRESFARELRPGDRIVLYTDGLVERRDEHLDLSLARLASQVGASAGGTNESVADELLASWGDSNDDVALLVVDVG